MVEGIHPLVGQFLPYIKIFLSVLYGFILGYERKVEGKYVGPRTYSLICLGACIFTLAALDVQLKHGSGLRIAAQVVTGIGFLGAGVIWKVKDHIHGITTAASIWAAAAIGLLIGFGYMGLAAFSTIVVFFLLKFEEEKILPDECM